MLNCTWDVNMQQKADLVSDLLLNEMKGRTIEIKIRQREAEGLT